MFDLKKNQFFVVMMCTLLSGATVAQNVSDDRYSGEEVKGDSGVVEIHEVERGFYVGLEIGGQYMLSSSAPAPSFSESPLGQRLKLNIGYDIANNIGLDFFVLGIFNQRDVDPAAAAANTLSGDVLQMIPGASLKFAFITKKHTFTYARGGAGLNFWIPGELVEPAATPGESSRVMGLYVEGAVGVEYYTKLRHISVGIEAGFGMALNPGASGAFVTVPIKYTF